MSSSPFRATRGPRAIRSGVALLSAGAVFADVDIAGATKLEVFDKAGKKLGTFAAPVRSDATGHSFVGVKFASAIIARVRITSGTGALGVQARDVSSGGAADLVIMDDFIYAEPQPQ